MKVAQILLVIIIVVSLGYVFVSRSHVQISKNGISFATKQTNVDDSNTVLSNKVLVERTQPQRPTTKDNIPLPTLKWSFVDTNDRLLSKKAVLVNGHNVTLIGDEFMATATADSSRVFNPSPVPLENLTAEGWSKEVKTKTLTIKPFVISEQNQKQDGYVKQLNQDSLLVYVFSEETANGTTTYRYFVSLPTPLSTLK